MTFRLALIVPLLAVSPAAAQDRSVGITYAPSLSLHDDEGSKVGCCMAAGAWITIDRLHVEYVAAWDFYRWKLRAEYAAEYAGRPGFFTEPDAIVDGQVLTVLWALRSWRTPQFRTRFEVGVRHGTAVDPIPRASGAGAGVTVDYGDGPIVLRGSGRFLWPKPPEFRIGLGFRF